MGGAGMKFSFNWGRNAYACDRCGAKTHYPTLYIGDVPHYFCLPECLREFLIFYKIQEPFTFWVASPYDTNMEVPF